MKKSLLIFALLFCVIYFFTHGFLNTFFQQDEWNGFGLVIYLAHQPIWSWFGMLTSQHFVPLTSSSWLLFYRIFSLQAEYYALTALILHTIASFLVYLLASRLSKTTIVGILTALFFATNARASLAFLHLAVFGNTVTSFICILLFFVYAAYKKKDIIYNKKDICVFLILFFSAVFFREDGLVIIPLFPLYLWFFQRKVFNRRNFWFFSIFFLSSFGFLLYRFLLQAFNPTALTVTNANYWVVYLYNVFTFPIKLIVLNIFNLPFLYETGWKIKNIIYPSVISQAIRDTVFYDVIFVSVLSMLLLIFIFLIKFKIILFQKYKNIFLFGFVWILISAFLLASVGRQLWAVESRYLYLSSFGVLFILSISITNIWRYKIKRVFAYKVKQFFVASIVLFILINSYIQMQNILKIYQEQSKPRKHIISEIKRLYPTIPKNTIFYIKCKKECYRNTFFGLPNSIVLPFTSGPGWIILLQYAKDDEQAYAPFFSRVNGKEFLWDYGSEGYRRIGSYSFGYFITKDLLKETIKKQNLDKRIIIGLEYDEEDFSLKDISSKIMEEL